MSNGFQIENGILTSYTGSDAIVTIPDGVTEIGWGSFECSKTLTELIMPDSVTKIAHGAFRMCRKLKSVVFSKQLTSIDNDAFRECKALKEAALPDTLKTLGAGAFAGCVKLAKLTCASPALEVEGDPFYAFSAPECTLLFDENGFLVFNNVLYEYSRDEETVTVPNGVTVIADNVFKSGTLSFEKKRKVKKIVLPDSVTRVGKYAFYHCVNLETLEMPDGIEFGVHAFSGCAKLADENGMVIIGNTMHAYLGDSTVVEIPAGVEILSEDLFRYSPYGSNPICKEITKVVLPEGLKHIGKAAFRGCTSLREINIPNSVTTIDADAFYDCVSLTGLSIPETTAVYNHAFNNCKGLADETGFIIINDFLFQYLSPECEVTVPEGVKIIGTDAFSNLLIKKITLPETLIGLADAFTGCECLEEITIPHGITTIVQNTFKGCRALRKVSLPDTVTAIGQRAFANCEALEEIQIPDSVAAIGPDAFEECKALKSIAFPKMLEKISQGMCRKCSSLETVTIPHAVRVIERIAFGQCISLKSVSLPEGVETIEACAFDSCTQLETLTIANRACDADLTAFENCPKLIDENGMKIIAGVLIEYTGEGGQITLPDTVTTIAPNVFREGDEWQFRTHITYRPKGSLQEITLPASVKAITEAAFCGCTALKKVTLSEGLETIDSSAFADCKSLSEISLPSTVKSIDANAFSRCTNLTEITLPAALAFIHPDAFRNCSALKSIAVDEGNKTYAGVDGVLYSADQTKLLYYPAAKKGTTFAVADSVAEIGDHAFIDAKKLKQITIPASVKKVGSEVFVRATWSSTVNTLPELRIAIGAGSESVGADAIDFPYGDDPLVCPTIPVTFPKEQTAEVRLCLGFCQSPEKYSPEYAEEYRKYAQSHQKTLLKKAAQQKLTVVEAYFAATKKTGGAAVRGYQPDLSLKKPNELQKVEILEEVVRKGTLDDLKAVLSTYKTFEMMARALGLACRYRGVEFVRVLVDHGATFRYDSNPNLQRKYTMEQKTAAGSYSTEYYLMLVPQKFNFKYNSFLGSYAYDYTPMYGISFINISDELEANVLPLEERLEVVKFLAGKKKKVGLSMDELLFWALVKCELSFADALMEMGVDLQDTPPSYYPTWGTIPSYLEIITDVVQSVYWTSYMSAMAKLEADQLLPVLQRFHTLASSAGKQLALTQKLFDDLKWNDATMAFAITHLDVSKINQKKALEAAVTDNQVAALTVMADAGWLSQTAKLNKLIDYAMDNNKQEALAWLIDYKNRTVDIAAEEAKEEAKMLRELTENPNSVSALKKIWSYKKLDDGTLQITSYKGSDTEVVIPEKIGKSAVSSIGEYAFSTFSLSRTPANLEVRKNLTSVVLPEGLTEIETGAFNGCEALVSVSLPSTLKTIGPVAFRGCKSLGGIEIPEKTKQIGHGVFWGCPKMYSGSFLIVNHILFAYSGDEETVTIPSGVVTVAALSFKPISYRTGKMKKIVIPDTVEVIGESAFESTYLETLEIPSSVKRIEDKAFYNCRALKEVRLSAGLTHIGKQAFYNTSISALKLPGSVTTLGSGAFDSCSKLRNVSIPDSTNHFGKKSFGWTGSGLFFHLVKDSPAAAFAEKDYSEAVIFYDYGEGEF